jgi:hypothetical protein
MDDGLSEGVERLAETAFGAAIPVVAAFEIELLGLGIGNMMGEGAGGMGVSDVRDLLVVAAKKDDRDDDDGDEQGGEDGSSP